MSFCEHCQGQRFDRARVLRVLRQMREELRTRGDREHLEDALGLALKAVRDLEIPHLEPDEEEPYDGVVH